MQGPKKVAIVGSGCTGIGALWALKSTDHEVHLFEADQRLGGHTNTVTFKKNNLETKVDVGFIVLNSATYPNFIAFLKDIGVDTTETDMTLSVSRDRGLFEWSGTSLRSVFAQKSNIFSLHMWQLLFDFIRFNQFALDLLSDEDESETDPSGSNGTDFQVRDPSGQISIGEYLERENYSEAFKTDYLIPMTAAVWSTTPDKVYLNFPAITLVRFMWNHHLLSTVAARPTWMTIPGGSQQYIDSVMKDFPKERVHLNAMVTSTQSLDERGVSLRFADGSEEVFDHIILTTHGDQALDIISGSATQQEKDILSGFHFSENKAVLHSDQRVSTTTPLPSPQLTIPPANAHPPRRLDSLELHIHRPAEQRTSLLHLSHLLDEPPAAHPLLEIRAHPRDPQPRRRPGPSPRPRHLDLPPPTVQRRRNTLPETAPSYTEYERYQLCRCVDEVWVP